MDRRVGRNVLDCTARLESGKGRVRLDIHLEWCPPSPDSEALQQQKAGTRRLANETANYDVMGTPYGGQDSPGTRPDEVRYKMLNTSLIGD